ncbi:pyrroline-5-carboxylate reductase [Corynebacterium aquatimens]|uniref:pyrroline-5-carboxylate reductase n=1 Tax=Corynebacterium TaxID=1716 RepID=UPI001F382046|nr:MULTISPECIES: pyrroline-5-carboxylate reductase [Corynebacterium]QYH20486.1 pyrroline-5-carboxylate reductase [Corynebacterium aquatimens]UIZ93257.1 pyrroline-5-carboxylate reductase [Corynebacterium sp. CNCTC7651]
MGKIAVIGAGSIGEALIAGMVAAGVDPRSIVATNRSSERSAALAERFGIETSNNNVEAVTDADVALLCVKPAQIADVLAEIGDTLAVADDCAVVVSMAAGVTLATMEEAVPVAGAPIVRVMPNTPMLVGKGVLAVAYGRYVAEDQREAVHELLATAGRVIEVDEGQLNAVTALSGSGPAYFFLLAEALIDAGVALGLPRELARELARSTAAGAGAMLERGDDPVALRAGVSSPAGTTVAAIRELEESGLRGALYRATEKCAQRAGELSHR